MPKENEINNKLKSGLKRTNIPENDQAIIRNLSPGIIDFD